MMKHELTCESNVGFVANSCQHLTAEHYLLCKQNHVVSVKIAFKETLKIPR